MESLSQPTGRPRRAALGVAAALVLASGMATPALAADNWSGVWHTKNKFGTPTLKLDKKGDHVEGTYKDDGGKLKGTIAGELSNHNRVWEGGYSDKEDSGSFKVKLQSDQVTFEGWFKSFGTDKKHDWTGEHA